MNRPNEFEEISPHSQYSLLKTTLIVISVFTFIALVSSIDSAFGRRSVPWTDAFVRSMVGWNSWIVTIPAALALARLYSIEKNPLWKSILVLLAVTFVVIFIKACTLEFLNSLIRAKPYRHTYFERVMGFMNTHRIIIESLIFWFILALSYAFQNFQNLKERELFSKRLEFELTQAKFNTLQMQLQPHFLFNTLNSISSLLRNIDDSQLKENVTSADRMITSLSEMFRHTLTSSKSQTISLREELCFLDNYLTIEKMRYTDRLTIEKDIDKSLESRIVPSFFLQPIVENAIRHGISRLSDDGLVRIKVYKDNVCLCFIIQDNGPCSEEELLQSLDKGIGLSNTLKRLNHLYGETCSFKIYKNDQRETEVKIRIPDYAQTDERSQD
jgi:two-component system LytT family sensor kinase